MDEMRKMLDSLMGNSRDQDLELQKKNKGKNFTQDSVCKCYLLGFCPQGELAASKMMGKRNIKDCKKTHSDAMKQEYGAHPDKEKYKFQYQKALLAVLEGLVREADAWAARERQNVQRNVAETPEQVQINNMPAQVKEQYDQLQADMDKLMAAAEEEAEKGNVDGSKFKVMLAGEIKDKIQELEDKHIVLHNVSAKGEEVCAICGTRTEASTTRNTARYDAHFTGKVHLIYVKVREWIAELKKTVRGGDYVENAYRVGSDRKDKKRSQSREADRRKRNSRSREKEKSKEAEHRRRRSRSREKDKEKDRDRGDRARSDRGRDQDRRRSRSKRR